MRFVHLLSRLTGTPWLIEENALANIVSLLDSRIAGLALAPESVMPAKAALPVGADGVAVIPIQGVIGKKLSPLEMACGGCDINALESAFDAANADPRVQKIVLAIDSPGGTVQGVPELARHIYESKSKPVEAVSDTLIGSAAYYLAASADSITVTPTARVGSIGTALVVREATATDVKDGLRLRIFRSGADKMPGMDGPLSETQAKHLQAGVDLLGDMFRQHVGLCRPSVPAFAMTGLAYFGEQSKELGLVDRVVPTLSAVAQ